MKFMNLSRSAVRAFTTSTSRSNKTLGMIPNSTRYQKIVELQKLMTANDGALVWQKRGPRDMIPFYVSGFLCTVGLLSAFYNLGVMSFPRKN